MRRKTPFKKRITVLGLIICFLVTLGIPPGTAKAESVALPDSNINRAIEWLVQNQNDDGSWGKNKEVMFLDTTSVAEYLKENNIETNSLMKSKNWIKNLKPSNNDLIARMLPFVTEEEMHSSLIEKLIKSQNEDGGWGISANFDSNPLDTIIALNTLLLKKDLSHEAIANGVKYLLGKQDDKGAWAYNEGAETSISLTAQAILCINEIALKTNSSSSDIDTSLRRAGEYLLSKRNVDNTWGTDAETLDRTLLAYRAVINTIGIEPVEALGEQIINLQNSDGSWNQSSYLTIHAIKALSERLEIPTGRINAITLTKNENDSNIETYSFNAYESFGINVQSEFNPAEAKLTLLITKPDGTIVSAEGDGKPSWNTRNEKPGEYAVIAQIKENKKGRIIASGQKNFTILPSFNISSVIVSKSHEFTTQGNSITVGTDAKIINAANIDKEIQIKTKVYSGENIVASSSKTATCMSKEQLLKVDTLSFTPDVTSPRDYIIRTEVYYDDTKISEGESIFKVLPPPSPTRIDAGQSLDKALLYPGTDNVNASFKLTGEGTPDMPQRKPIDLVIVIDDSGSMEWGNDDYSTTKPWRIDFAKEASKHVIDLIQSQDRGAIVEFAGSSWIQQDLTGDKELIRKRIDETPKSPWNGTGIGLGLRSAISVLDKKSTVDRDKVILLLSDGYENVWSNSSVINQAKDAKTKGYKIFTIGLGTDVDRNLLMTLADTTGGNYAYSPTMEQLDNMMGMLAGDIFDTAGKNVTLETTVPQNAMKIDPEKISPKPSSTVKNVDGSLTLKWEYERIIMGQEKSIQISYNGTNLVSDTNILLTRGTKLTYEDKNNTRINVSLPDMSIPVNKYMLDTTITTDKEKYISNEEVQVNVSSKNLTENTSTLTGKIEIFDKNNNLVDTAEQNISTQWQPGEVQTLNSSWNTGKTIRGDYKARITWCEGGKVISVSEKSFEITADGLIASDISVNKASYDPNEDVKISVKINNTSTNSIEKDLTVKAKIEAPDGKIIWSEERIVREIAQGGQANENYTWNTSQMPPGEYTITSQVYMGDKMISEKVEKFTIASSSENLKGLNANLEVITKDIYPSNDAQFKYVLTNNGNVDIEDLNIRIRIVDTETKEVVGASSETINISVNAVKENTLTVKHDILKTGKYLVVLDAVTKAGETISLGSGSLNVLKPYITTITNVVRPRVLVWAESQINIDFAEAALTNMEVFHKVVKTSEEFMTELGTGKYNQYTLLDCKTPLNGGDDLILANEVAKGKGLVATGDSLLDNFKTLGIFGAKFRGYAGPFGYSVDYSESSPFGALKLNGTGKVQVLELLQGEQLSKMSSRRGLTPGTVLNQYQNGKAMLFAFDLGSSIGDNQAVLKKAVELTAPANEADHKLDEFEIRINAKDAVGAEVKLCLPEGAELIWSQPSLGAENGTWDFNTEPEKEYILRALVHLPEGPGEYPIRAESYYSVSGQSIKFDTAETKINRQ